jgi:hypothetical protein
MADAEGRPEATETADLYHRHEADPSKWEEAPAVTGRPADVPSPNTTLADRAKARKGGAKKVDKDAEGVEDKAVKAAESKAPTKKAAPRKG